MQIKLFIFVFPLFFIITACNRQSVTSKSKSVDISYYPIKEVSDFLTVEASCNGGKKEYFILDTGYGTGEMMMDSAHFYDHIYTDKLEHLDIDYKMIYWETFYRGNVDVNIAGDTVRIANTNIKVNTLFQRKNLDRNPKLMGILGVDVFADRITVLNFKENLMAFTDTFNFDINNFAVIDLEKARTITDVNKEYRFVSVNGFITKDGGIKKGLFLLDTGWSNVEMTIKSSFGSDIQYEKKQSRKAALQLGGGEWVWKSSTLAVGNNYKLDSIEISVSTLPPGQEILEMLTGADGLIGLPFLKRFDTVVLDYKNNKLYLKIA